MQFPTINPRRPLDDEHPDGYAESDRDYVENNLDAAVWLLDNCAELSRQLHFWRDACDDAHNLGADRLMLAVSTLLQAERLFNEALPKFNWGASALDANSIDLLNTVPTLVRNALEELE